ncbi:fibroblast growth factor-binding protein 2 [Thalassophryne amazonica]|uniref:fibroblast growth factor-binding protein 2 n=1 Tax=Thalassophryne amazonica TaxID=390379 RepID=UPI0014719278|nr:fibroblast growth factor-binding protein 2 [Thalassophryne amazonica]
MWTQGGTLLLLSACCCFCLAEAQSNRNRTQSIRDDPVKFKTKAKDLCTMIITGQEQITRLRLSCQSNSRSYWCDYMGKPSACRSYNKNPRHYFVQMMWSLRKLHNACLGLRMIKPQMCKKATDESQMVFSSASFSRTKLEASRMRSRLPAKSEIRPAPTRPESVTSSVSSQVSSGAQSTQGSSPQPTATAEESNAKKMAQQYCWRSLQGICAYFIAWFRN